MFNFGFEKRLITTQDGIKRLVELTGMPPLEAEMWLGEAEQQLMQDEDEEPSIEEIVAVAFEMWEKVQDAEDRGEACYE